MYYSYFINRLLNSFNLLLVTWLSLADRENPLTGLEICRRKQPTSSNGTLGRYDIIYIKGGGGPL